MYTITLSTKINTTSNLVVGVYNYIDKIFGYSVEVGDKTAKPFESLNRISEKVVRIINSEEVKTVLYVEKYLQEDYLKKYYTLLGMVFSKIILPDDVRIIKLRHNIISAYAVGRYMKYPAWIQQANTEFNINLPNEESIAEVFWGCLLGTTYLGLPSTPQRRLAVTNILKGDIISSQFFNDKNIERAVKSFNFKLKDTFQL